MCNLVHVVTECVIYSSECTNITEVMNYHAAELHVETVKEQYGCVRYPVKKDV